MNARSTLPSFFRSNLGRIIAIGAVNLMLVAPAIGQTTSLPLSTIEGATLGGSQMSQISSFVDHWSTRAMDGDTQSAARAQGKLLEPLINSRVSISFRQAYSDALASHLDALNADGSVGSTLSMLRIAGELGTSRSTGLILSGLDSDDAGVRIFAAGRAGRTFRTTAANGPAMSANDLTSLVTKLGEVSSSTNDTSLLSACIQALGQGCSLPSDDFLAPRAACMEQMCTAASNYLTLDGTDLESRARIAMLATGSATNSLLQVGESSTNDAIKAAVALGADMISISLSDVVNGTMPALGSRDLQTKLVSSGESLLYFALRKHAELNGRPAGNVEQTTLAALLESGEDREFRNKAALLLGAGSPIITAFDFADDRFVN